MEYHILCIRTLIVFLTCLMLQSCFVQKNSESHASVIYDLYTTDTSSETETVHVVTVEENTENRASLEALNTSLLLIDFHKEHRMNRWEDQLSFKSNEGYVQPIPKDNTEVLKPIANKN